MQTEYVRLNSEYGYPDERQDHISYSHRQQFRRILWWLGEFIFFKYSLRPMYAWRRFILQIFGARLGNPVYIRRNVRIEFPWNLEMGRYSSIGENAWIYNLDKVRIGEFTTISLRVFLCTCYLDYTHPEFNLITKPIIVGNGAWLAADVYVGPGVKIGDHAVIGARSVVIKDMPADMVCAGHPCKPIKPRLPKTNMEKQDDL